MLNKGETIYCKNNKELTERGWKTLPITIGRPYIINDIIGYWYIIVNDKGRLSKVYHTKFLSLSDIRELKIDEILYQVV